MKIIKSLFLSIFLVLALTLPALAKDFPSQQNVALDKVWKIAFSQSIGKVTSSHITLYRTDVEPDVKVDILIGINEKYINTFLIDHIEPFVAGASYRLTVDSDAISASGTKTKEDANLYFTTINPVDNLIPDKETLEDIQTYIRNRYSSVTIDGHTIKYNIMVGSYPGNDDGTHIGSAFIMLNTTQDTVFTQGYVVTNCQDAYFKWVATMLDDIQSHYGKYQYNGGIWTLADGYQVMFENWSGSWRYTVPK